MTAKRCRCESPPTLSDKLQVVVNEEHNSATPVDWNRIRDFVGNIRLSSRPCFAVNEEFWQLMLDLTQLFEKRDCRDVTFIAQVLELAWRVSFHKRNEAEGLLSAIKNPDRHIIKNSLTAEFMKIFYLPYRVVHALVDMHEDAVSTATAAGRVGVLELLLRFGATPLEISAPTFLWEYCTFIAEILFPGIEVISEKQFEILVKRENGLKLRLRLVLVMKCLVVFLKLKQLLMCQSPPDHYIASLRLLFRAIPEPFVTGKEICNVLQKLLQSKEDEKINSVAEEFGTYFPESREPLGPRSLQHLCRCQVRESIRTSSFAFRLPQAIDSLPLPKKIKEYISLREVDIGTITRTQ